MKYITKEVRIGIAGIVALCVLIYGAAADYNKVLRTKRTITAQFKDAFIVAFRNGEKMNVNEAIAEFKKRKNK